MSSNSGNDRSEDRLGNMVAVGLAIGAGFGVALGLVFDNLALGIAIGAGMGMAVGAGLSQRAGMATPSGTRVGRGLLAALVMGAIGLLGLIVLALLLIR
ncbi:MAG: hypothetical protein M8467_14865 [Anaerolineae bacterium]|nr:hypothetical protein [Anaerolineae bacterium]